MTSAELKTLRESLGLPVSFLATQANVQRRTVEYWESGRNKVPEDVSILIINIENNFAQIVENIIGLVKEKMPSDVALIRYKTDEDLWKFRPDFKQLPATAHAALISRCRRELWKIGIKSIIEYMIPDEYLKWLNGRSDSEDLRAEWALSLPY
jgi:transcriptional regulator with XRE-family HTH domain